MKWKSKSKNKKPSIWRVFFLDHQFAKEVRQLDFGMIVGGSGEKPASVFALGNVVLSDNEQNKDEEGAEKAQKASADENEDIHKFLLLLLLMGG